MTPEEIAALKAGDKITVEVEVEERGNRGDPDGIWVLLKGGSEDTFFTYDELAHATLTPAPEPPLAVGEMVMFRDYRWEVVAPPRVRRGNKEVALWRDDLGYEFADVTLCTRVQP